jgi:DNA-binding protein
VSRSNTVFVGNKPVLNYVLACITLFRGDEKEVILKARGRAISHAVDVAEVMRNRFMPDVKIKKITIGTEEVSSREENRMTNVSTMEITLTH